MTLHRILATLVMTRARHVQTVRQKKQELTRNNYHVLGFCLLQISFVLEKGTTPEERELNERFLKNLSNHQLTDTKVNLLSWGLKFVPTAMTNTTNIRRQLLQDFELFTRRMPLQYIVHGQNKEPHPFHVISNWMPPVQQSGALESYLESVKTQPADIKITQPKQNLSCNEMAAFKPVKKQLCPV